MGAVASSNCLELLGWGAVASSNCLELCGWGAAASCLIWSSGGQLLPV